MPYLNSYVFGFFCSTVKSLLFSSFCLEAIHSTMIMTVLKISGTVTPNMCALHDRKAFVCCARVAGGQSANPDVYVCMFRKSGTFCF